MTDRVPYRLIDASLGQPWLIERSALENLVAIVTRAADVGEGMPVLVPPAAMGIADGVARIPIRGPIMRYPSIMTTHCGATAVDRIAADFDLAMVDSSVQRIELVIDSPGGQAAGIDAFADRVYAARSRKPIVARVESLAASAAYWIATAASRIEITETAALGSVGVVLTVQRGGSSRSELEIVSSQSPKKRQDPTSPEGRADLQQLVDAHADGFVNRVAAFRGVTRDHVLSHFGQGWLRSGLDAITARMADSIDAAPALPRLGAGGGRVAATPESRWDADVELRREFGFDKSRWLAYATRRARS